jgi:5-methylcytosine-specific restriction endonuclease McrA
VNRKHAHGLWLSAKHRARDRNIAFDIEPEHVVIPKKCPLCKQRLVSQQGRYLKDDSPTVDRLIPADGYIPGNIWVVCRACNNKKTNVSPAIMVRTLIELMQRNLLEGELKEELWPHFEA